MAPYSKDYEIDYTLLYPDLRANFVKMMALTQEISIAHTDSTNMPMKWYADNKKGWLIVNSRAEVYSYPKYGDIIRVETAPCGFKGILGERNFSIYDKNGSCMLKAVTKWIYTDLSKRRPERPEMEMIKGYGEILAPCLEKDYSLPSEEGFDLIHTYEFSAGKRDMDTNSHVNNIKYIEWALEGVPDDVYYDYSVAEMKASYKKECSKGDYIIVDTYARNTEYLSVVSKREPDGSKSALAQINTVWKRF